MGLTRQSAKVRGQGECFSLGAEFRVYAEQFSPSPGWGTTDPDTQASHNANEGFLPTTTNFQMGGQGEKPRWESFPTAPCQQSSFLRHTTPGCSWSSRTRGQKRLHSLIVRKRDQWDFPRGPRTEGVMWYNAHPSQQRRHQTEWVSKRQSDLIECDIIKKLCVWCGLRPQILPYFKIHE